jgi:hypothetical protein
MTKPSHEELEAAWRAAAADAVLERPARLWLFDGASRPDHQIACLYPSESHYNDPDSEKVADELDEALLRGEHRIGLWIGDRPVEVCTGLLRHELAHAEQEEANSSELAELNELASQVLRLHPGAPTRWGELYNSIPTEVEANATAARYMRTLLSPFPIEELVVADPNHRSLLTREGSGQPLDTLERRMVEFLAQHRDVCERYAAVSGWSGPFVALLRSRARQLWNELVPE